MGILLIVVAFGFGFLASAARLPPLVGYLVAGFVLHGFGAESNEEIEFVADLGVLMLLFGIGLKLRLTTMAKPEVWAGATLHLVGTAAMIGAAFLVLGALGLPLAAGLSAADAALVGFAFSFSSTVFAVKALEERNEAASLPGRVAIGILIVQDLAAVAFLTVAVDQPPSLWAVPVVAAVVAARPALGWVLDRTGHGELLVLFGFSLAVGVGMGAFEQVGLKPDLGALLAGLVLAGHRRAPELADRLLGFKDILLIGFFLSIGLGGAPGGGALLAALVVLVLLPLKTAGYLAMLTRFRLRARTAWHSSITLANFSEFGLIVAAVGVDQEMLDQQWASAVAVAVAASFALAAPVSTARYQIYGRLAAPLASLERRPIRADDTLIEPTGAGVLVFGMGRVGTGAYDELVARGATVIGVDRLEAVIAANQAEGRRMLRGDALDRDFWERIQLHPEIELVVLATNNHAANLETVGRVKAMLPDVLIAGAALHADEVEELIGAGVHVARNLYGEAGQGLADDASDLLFRARRDGPRPAP